MTICQNQNGAVRNVYALAPMNNTAKATLYETGLGPVSKSKQPTVWYNESPTQNQCKY